MQGFFTFFRKSSSNGADIYISFCHDNALLNMQDGVSCMHNEVWLLMMMHNLCIFYFFGEKSYLNKNCFFGINYFLAWNFISWKMFMLKKFFFINSFYPKFLLPKYFFTKSIDRLTNLLQWILLWGLLCIVLLNENLHFDLIPFLDIYIPDIHFNPT